jgi:hypothetical protein
VADLDFDRLARFRLTGGNIRNISVNAAFLAASKGEQVSMPVVLSAIRTEMLKHDRLLDESDFVL